MTSMEIDESPRANTDEQEGTLSCWGRMKLKLPWGRRGGVGRRGRRISCTTTRQRRVGWNIKDMFKSKRPAAGGGGFNYDPLSYAQNFDGGWEEDDDEDYSYRGFSSRYAAPLKPVGSS